MFSRLVTWWRAKMADLFKKGVVYPCDETGPFEEVIGRVVQVDDYDDDDDVVCIHVDGDRGKFSGFYRMGHYQAGHRRRSIPAVDDVAMLHVYNAGGGWYPDNKVVRWVTMRVTRC